MNKQSYSSDSLKSIPLVACPSCCKAIPLVSLKPANGQMHLELKCKCSKESTVFRVSDFVKMLLSLRAEVHQCGEHLREAAKYCVKCMEWLCDECIDTHYTSDKHVLCDNELEVQCRKHKKAFTNYCTKCHCNCCFKCRVNEHFGHGSIFLLSIVYGKPKMNLINDFKAKNKRLTMKLNQRIDTQSNNLSNPSKMKAELQSAYDLNAKINEDIELLYLSLFKTSLTFFHFPSFELEQLQRIVVNSQPNIEEDLSIEEEYDRLLGYIQTNYLLRKLNQLSALPH